MIRAHTTEALALLFDKSRAFTRELLPRLILEKVYPVAQRRVNWRSACSIARRYWREITLIWCWSFVGVGNATKLIVAVSAGCWPALTWELWLLCRSCLADLMACTQYSLTLFLALKLLNRKLAMFSPGDLQSELVEKYLNVFQWT